MSLAAGISSSSFFFEDFSASLFVEVSTNSKDSSFFASSSSFYE
jgi:hypothetical protein